MLAIVAARCPQAITVNMVEQLTVAGGGEVRRNAHVHLSYDVSTEIPASPAALIHCGPTVTSVPVVIAVPAASNTPDPNGRPSWRVMRAASFSPLPPFHPPRAI